MGLTVLDAGVVIAILDAGDAHHTASREAIETLNATGEELAVPASAYGEILVGAFRTSAEAAALVDDFVAALPAAVEPASRSIARRAAQLRATHGNRFRLPDALVAATAIELGADRVLTTDRGWPKVEVDVVVVGRTQPVSTNRSPA